MFQLSTLALLFALLSRTTVFATCPTSLPLEFCCMDLVPYSNDLIFLDEVCGLLLLDESTIIGTTCVEPLADGCASFHGWYDSCCEAQQTCFKFSPDPIGINCTGTLIE